MGIRQRISFISFLFFLVLLGANSVLAQEVTKDTTIYEKDGRKFYRYVVVPGNTLYSISKLYNVSVHDIEEHNPKSKSGLSIGDTLFIIAAEKDKGIIQKKMEVDGDIIVHEVQKKQTLYAISKIYGISIADILAINPEIKKGVKEGQLIKIPIVKLKKAEEETQVFVDDNYIKHNVSPKETLYSLSKLYGVPIDSIKAANGGLPEGLKEGQVLIIPKTQGMELPVDSGMFKEKYVVSMILPMFLDLNDTLIANLKIDDKEQVLAKSTVSIQFYQGALVALDSLKKEGLKFEVRVYDSAKDTSMINDLIDKDLLSDVDLIIGPFYLSEFMRFSEYAKEHQIHIVCPVPQNNKVLLGNEFVSKVATSRNIIFKNLGKYVSYLYGNQNVVIVGQLFRANPLAFAFKNEFLNALRNTGDTASVKNLKEVKWDNGDISSIVNELKDSVYNIIVIPSNDQVYVTQLLAKLNTIHEDYKIKVIGIDQWMRYTNIDFEYFDNLGVMVGVDGHVDFDRPHVKSFVKNYHKRFEIFPEKFAFQGFDITHYYLKALHKYGTRLETGITQGNEKYLYFNFGFFKTGMESGYENKSTILLKYQNFELVEFPVAN